MEKNIEKVWLSPREVELEYGIAVSTLAKWRMKKQNVKFSKVGKAVKYKRMDIENFLDSVSVMAEVD